MFQKIMGIVIALFVCSAAFGQGIKVTKLAAGDIPKDIAYKGKMKNAVQWSDKEGSHIVVTTETGEQPSKTVENNDYDKDASVHAYHYMMKDVKATEMWKVYDGIKNCELDMQVAFIKNTFHITDLDKDGVAEVWVMYKMACHGDMSPCEMKVIMYEGTQKYAMRGENKIVINETKESFGGEYKFDEAFLNGSKLFREHAKKMWQDNIMEEWYNG